MIFSYAFHGHSCGGLALGYKACELAAEKLGLHFSEDEEIVAVTETDSCTVDAIQVLLGCTAGKGLVAVPDAVPKNARMVELRPKIMDGSATPAEDEEYHRLLHEHVHEILATPAEKLFIIKDAVQPLPKEAKIYNNVVCSVCGEQVADGLAQQSEGKYICIPCQMRK